MYQDTLYDLTGVEYCDLETKLDYLDKLADDAQTQASGFEWVVYEFLTTQGYDLPKPDYAKPRPIPKEWDDPVEGPSLATKAKDVLFQRVTSKHAADREYGANRTPRIPYEEASSFSYRNNPPPIGRDARANDAGGCIGIAIIIIFGLAATLSDISKFFHVPYPQTKIVEPIGRTSPVEGGKTTTAEGDMPSQLEKQLGVPKTKSIPAPKTVTPVKQLSYNQKVARLVNKSMYGLSVSSPQYVPPSSKPSNQRGIIPKEKLGELLRTAPIRND